MQKDLMRKDTNLKPSQGKEHHRDSEMAKGPETGAGPVRPNNNYQGCRASGMLGWRRTVREESGIEQAQDSGSQALITSQSLPALHLTPLLLQELGRLGLFV